MDSRMVIFRILFFRNNSEVCIPKKLSAKKHALFSSLISIINLHTITSSEMYSSYLDQIINFIVTWNTTMNYGYSGNEKKGIGNSQDFVFALLKKLEIKSDFLEKGGNPIGDFLNHLKSGKYEKEFFF